MDKWVKTSSGNYILETEGVGFYISYRGDGRSPENTALATYNLMGSFFGLDTAPEETALVVPNSIPKYRILNGDFRKEYEEACPLGLEACVAVYEKHKTSARSDWSGDED